MTCRLINIDGLSIQSLERRIDDGYRFIVYSYSISLLFNISYVSPAYLLRKEDVKKHTLKYNTLSSILGWWSLQGIPNTINSLKTNMKGGIDVTEDIMINLNQDSLNARKVKIEYIYTIFAEPTKSIVKDFIKAIKKTKGLDFNQNIYLGKSINTEESSYSLIFQNISAEAKGILLINLKKVFSPHVEINISQINIEDDLNQKLIEQGQKLEFK